MVVGRDDRSFEAGRAEGLREARLSEAREAEASVGSARLGEARLGEERVSETGAPVDRRGPGLLEGRWMYRPTVGPAGLMLGIGLGGFADGIVLHQILQWHGMLSARLPLDSMSNMRVNMLADGVFHMVCWTATLLGLALLWRTLNRPHELRAPGRALIGWMLAGWGWFNLIEGIINHHVLQLHHVLEMLGQSLWDWMFLGSGVVLIIIGHSMARTARRDGLVRV